MHAYNEISSTRWLLKKVTTRRMRISNVSTVTLLEDLKFCPPYQVGGGEDYTFRGNLRIKPQCKYYANYIG